jgi:DNA recombination protein RmuC
MTTAMTVFVSIICVVLGIAIGFLVARLSSGRQSSEFQRNIGELEKQVAVLQSKLDAETRLVAEVREDANRQLAETRASSEKMLSAAKEDAARVLAEEKASAAKRLEIAKNEAAQQLAAVKSEAVQRLESAKRESAEQLSAMKLEMERVHQSSLAEQKARFEELSKRLVAEAKNATEEMLKQRGEELSKTGNATMEQLVNPLKETIAKMEKTMNDTTLQQTAANTSLKEVLKQSIESNAATKSAADDLVRAFKHDSKLQGDWGECVLEELLESLGLQEGIHFETQATLRDTGGNVLYSEETGRTMRPDVIVHLDLKKDVIVDSKVSMTAFMDYVACDDVEQRKDLLRKHIESLKKHVKELSQKDYSRYVKAPKKTMDFVIMFVPRSAALWAALNEEPALWRDAMEKNVFIADEQTLYAALRMVKLTWRQIQQAENQQKVFELANEMLSRVGQFVKQMNAIGDSLDKAQKAYKSGMSKFAEKGQSVLTTCRKLEQLGAKQDDKNPLPMEQEVIEMQGIENLPFPV